MFSKLDFPPADNSKTPDQNNNWWEDAYCQDYQNHQSTPRPQYDKIDKKRRYLHVSISTEPLPLNPTTIRGKQLLPKDDTRIYIK